MKLKDLFNIVKKNIFFAVFLVCPIFTSAQENDTIVDKPEPAAVNTNSVSYTDAEATTKFATVDAFVLKMKKRNKSVANLTKDITTPFTTEEEKVRAIFIWMTNNIGFDCVTYHNKKTLQGDFKYKTQEELEEKLEIYYLKYSMLVLRNKRAVAEGYAILFREFCKSAGINCLLVEGRASENKDKIKKLRNRKSFSSNHTWNKVQVNGVWYYIDVTWASGYCDKSVKKFTKKYNGYYFLTPLDNLYATHAENAKFTERRNNPAAD